YRNHDSNIVRIRGFPLLRTCITALLRLELFIRCLQLAIFLTDCIDPSATRTDWANASITWACSNSRTFLRALVAVHLALYE
ncbi:MAG: hypothetical protein ACFFER_06290, partial [Candidatus Thorarchaeota archaeon]